MWDLILSAVWLLFLAGWFAAYAYVRQPKQGTLEWIRMYDRPPFTCLGDRGKLEKQDIWWLLGCVAVSAGACLGLTARTAPLMQLGTLQTLILVMPVLGAAGVYLLYRLLKGQPLLGALCALAVVIPPLDPAAGPVMLAAACFYGWMSADADAPFWKHALWLLPFWLCMMVAAALSAPALWLLPFYGLLWLFTVIQRWRKGYGWGRILLNGMLCLLLLAVTLTGCLAFRWMQTAALPLGAMAAAVADGSLMTGLREMLAGLPAQLLRQPDWATVQALAPQAISLLAGVFAFVALLLHAFRGRSVGAAYLTLLTLGTATVYALGHSLILPVVCLADTAYVATLVWERKRKLLAVLLPALLLALHIGNYLLR